jgi:hypothetical protein
MDVLLDRRPILNRKKRCTSISLGQNYCYHHLYHLLVTLSLEYRYSNIQLENNYNFS